MSECVYWFLATNDERAGTIYAWLERVGRGVILWAPVAEANLINDLSLLIGTSTVNLLDLIVPVGRGVVFLSWQK